MLRAFVVKRSSVRGVAWANEINSLFDASTLMSGMSIAWAIDGLRMARRQMSKSRNIEAIGKSAVKALSSTRTQRQLQGWLGLSISLHSAV
jgi:hypothetical protein